MKKVMLLVLGSIVLLMSGCGMAKDADPYYDPDPYYDHDYIEGVSENPFISVNDLPVSTFSADVDTASYSIIRQMLNDGYFPDQDDVRIEELVNYFDYDLPSPLEGDVFGVTSEIHPAPWNPDHDLLMIGINTEEIEYENTLGSNIVFLIDTSGSMSDSSKLPLLITGLKLFVDEIRPQDKISVVTYGTSSDIRMNGANDEDKEDLLALLDSLYATGSTNGEAGLDLAYQVALENYIEGGINRVILCTDGDFNIGVSGPEELADYVEEKRDSFIYMSVLGFGSENASDESMETIADKGNGVYYFIDSILEAKKVLVSELGGTLYTVAKDVKFQIEFNPMFIKGYRLIGYENRMLNYDDFYDDSVDAGEVGAGHEVIIFYEIIPVTSDEEIDQRDYEEITELKYNGSNYEDELATININYKDPENDNPFSQSHVSSNLMQDTSDSFLFGSSVVEFGLLLRDSQYKGNADFDQIINRAILGLGEDVNGYRAEFIDLVLRAKELRE